MEDPFNNRWINLEASYQLKSQYTHFQTYKLRPVIVKANDDLRQEVLAVQLMKRMSKIFEEANINLYLRPYEIFITSSSSGIIDFIPDTVSIDGLKKKFPKRQKPWNLKIFFEKYY
jgi:phosphatidylinositol kinase/protein kinase (PI-3  family)